MILGRKWAVIVTVGIAVVYLVMPQERIDRTHESWLRLTGDPGQACLDFERRVLKDADSARLLTVTAVKDSMVTITYRAKNGYGAYDQSTAVCSVDGRGEINESNTRIARLKSAVDRNSQRMDDAIACLQRRIEVRRELKRQGRYSGEDDKEMGAPCPTE